MRTLTILCCLALLSAAGCRGSAGAPAPQPEVLGVRLGLSKEAAHARLRQLGQLEKQESKQQEVWKLSNDPRYSHLIVAYNKDYSSMRFATAVAKEGGERVRYTDVIDIGRARKDTAGNTVTYTLEVPASEGAPAFFVKLIGNNPDYLQYNSVELK